jgi:hypothetical protein
MQADIAPAPNLIQDHVLNKTSAHGCRAVLKSYTPDRARARPLPLDAHRRIARQRFPTVQNA